jgi:hypothetical protein
MAAERRAMADSGRISEHYEQARAEAARQQAIAGCDAVLRALRRHHSFGCGELRIIVLQSITLACGQVDGMRREPDFASGD